MITKTDFRIFKAAKAATVERWAEHAAAAAEYAREGFIPRYCRHGAYNWSDFDVSCYACEEG